VVEPLLLIPKLWNVVLVLVVVDEEIILPPNGDVRGSYATNSAGMANLTELSRPLLLLLFAAANLISFTD